MFLFNEILIFIFNMTYLYLNMYTVKDIVNQSLFLMQSYTVRLLVLVSLNNEIESSLNYR